jgi:hypothetical protein
MSLDANQYANRAAREARQGKSESESRIYLDRAALLIPKAQQSFSMAVANDPARRGRMRIEFTDEGQDVITLDQGTKTIADIFGSKQLIVSALKWSVAFDGEDTEHKSPLIWMPEPTAIFGHTNGNYGRFTVFDDRILTKKKGGGLTDMQSLTLYANYIWNFTEDFPLPLEFENEAITELASLLLTNVAS